MHQKREWKAICIGGGASGLYFSHLVPQSLLVEKNQRVGLKLLATGGGMCNFTHDLSPRDMVEHYYEKKAFVSSAIYTHSPDEIRREFEDLGVASFVREDGCVFPRSRRSQDIVNALAGECRNILTGCEVLSVEKTDGHFHLETTKGELETKVLVIATGGLSYPQTGSTGDGFRFASSLGLSIVPPHSALCEIRLMDSLVVCKGISLDDVVLSCNGKKTRGPVVVTDRGLSGPAAMDLSRYIGRNDDLTIRFCTMTTEEITALEGRKLACNAIAQATGLPDRLVRFILGPDISAKRIAQLRKEELVRIASRLSSYRTGASTDGMMKRSTVTRGGVDTKEIDPKSFQAKSCPGLFVIGEALDVDGECGGYNLSFALASAFCAATSVLSHI